MRHIIRKATPEDAKAIAVILRTSRQSAMPYLPDLHTPDEDFAFIQGKVMPECEVWVAVVDNKLTGFCAFTAEWIEHLYLLPEAQGKGIGSQLLEKAREKADQLSLWTFKRNEAAKAFYEAKDFKPIRETDGQDNEEKEPYVLYHWRRLSRGKLIVICGLPGSGKTTLARRLEQAFNAVRFCPDEWMNNLSINLYDEQKRDKIERLQWDIAQKILSVGGCAIIEWGTWGRSERDQLREGAVKLGAKVELHYLTLDTEELFRRIQLRGQENPPITREMVQKWQAQMQKPDKDEFKLYDGCFVNERKL